MNIKKSIIGATLVMVMGSCLTIAAIANAKTTSNEETSNTLCAGVTANLIDAEGQEVFIDENAVYQTALNNYYYEKWLQAIKEQLEERKRQQEEVRISYEGENKIIDIPTTSYTIMETLIEVPNPDLQPLEQPTEEKPATILEPLQYGVDVTYKGLKTYMDYRTITATSSPQWALEHITDDYNARVDTIKASNLSEEEKNIQILQIEIPERYIYTDENGFRRLHCQNPDNSEYTDRYVIAVGSGITDKIGQYVDLIMENGTVVPCVVGDQKSDAHTDTFSHLMTSVHNPNNACASEFIVEQDKISPSVTANGDSSYGLGLVGVKVESAKVYNKNALK